MTCRHSLPGGAFSCRVLGFVLSPRWGGAVVVDGFGIAPVALTKAEAREPTRRTSFQVLNFRDVRDGPSQRRFLERQLARIIARYNPTIVAIGILDRYAASLRSSHQFVRDVLACRGIPVVERSLGQVSQILLGSCHRRPQEVLPETIARQFFPELPVRRHATEKRRYEEHAWNALATAIVTLAEHRPLSALTLAQPKAIFPPSFSTLLARAAVHL